EVIGAAHAVGGFPYLLDSGQQQADQYGNDGNDHQQLNQGEPATPRSYHGRSSCVRWEERLAYFGAASRKPFRILPVPIAEASRKFARAASCPIHDIFQSRPATCNNEGKQSKSFEEGERCDFKIAETQDGNWPRNC